MHAILRVGLRCFYIGLFAFLSGCSSFTAPAPGPVLARSYLDQIEMTGRLSARYEANYREQSISVNFTWSQSPDQTKISLNSPTGQTVATIFINAQGAQLKQVDKPTRYASDINALSTEVLGWPLPVAGLRDWLQGYISADHHTALGQADTDKLFNVDGWALRYASWLRENHIERPKRLDLSRQTEQAGLVSLRIVVDAWSTP